MMSLRTYYQWGLTGSARLRWAAIRCDNCAIWSFMMISTSVSGLGRVPKGLRCLLFNVDQRLSTIAFDCMIGIKVPVALAHILHRDGLYLNY